MADEPKKVAIDDTHTEVTHFQVLELDDCDVPIGQPGGLAYENDWIPNHHYDA